MSLNFCLILPVVVAILVIAKTCL